MNIVLWIAQALLALLFLAGGSFKMFSFAEVAKQFPVLPHAGWRVLGAVEVLGGLLLVVPGALGWFPQLTPIAAAVLTVETLALSAIFASRSLKLNAENPLVYNLVMALLAAFVAVGRYAISPFA